eukprot:scaffold12202_cov87-Skeletonema_marinoi.AAC.1
MAEHPNLNEIFEGVILQPKKSTAKNKGDNSVPEIIDLFESPPAKSKSTSTDVIDLSNSPVKGKSVAKTAISPRKTSAATKQQLINDVVDTDGEEGNSSGIFGHHIYDVAGDKATIEHLLNTGRLIVVPYHPFIASALDLYDEMKHLAKKGLFSKKGDCGSGVGRWAKRGPVYISMNDNPTIFKPFLTQHGGQITLGYIKFWEELCSKLDLEIVNIWITYYRSSFENELEMAKHITKDGYLDFGYMIDHGDTYPPGVIARVTTTMFEKMKEGKVKKRFRVSKESGIETHKEASFAAGNGTTVIMDSKGSGNTSAWKHGVGGAEDTWTITMQLKKTEKASGVGNLKDDSNY